MGLVEPQQKSGQAPGAGAHVENQVGEDEGARGGVKEGVLMGFEALEGHPRQTGRQFLRPAVLQGGEHGQARFQLCAGATGRQHGRLGIAFGIPAGVAPVKAVGNQDGGHLPQGVQRGHAFGGHADRAVQGQPPRWQHHGGHAPPQRRAPERTLHAVQALGQPGKSAVGSNSHRVPLVNGAGSGQNGGSRQNTVY